MYLFVLRYLISIVISCLCLQSWSQNHVLQDWLRDTPYNDNSNCIYSIGVSDPRMTDTDLAKEIAINRAITFAILINESKIFYVSDYYEERSEEYRWFILQEKIEELGKMQSFGYVDDDNFEVIKTEINSNGETCVLLKYFPKLNNKTPNFFINVDYYNQIFEISNTRALEKIRSVRIETSWKPKNKPDSVKSSYHFTNWNNSISNEVIFDGKTIVTPSYYFLYKSSLEDSLCFQSFQSYSALNKGLWLAYVDSYMQSVMLITKNFASKFGTVSDAFNEDRNDIEISGKTESLSRNSSLNILNFELGGMEVFNNNLYLRLYLKNNRTPYLTSAIAKSNEETMSKSEKKCFLIRLFKKNRNAK